jgi:SAM-dependent methyltransferase
MHVEARRFIEGAVIKYGPLRGDIVEIGSQNVNGGIRNLFKSAKSYLGIDIEEAEGVDLVIDAVKWQPKQKYDLVISMETFEHAPLWPQILSVMASALKDGGIMLITCATTPRQPHSANKDKMRPERDEYYENVDKNDFFRIATAIGLDCEVTTDNVRGDLYAVCRLKK